MSFIIITLILFVFAYILFKVFSTVKLELPESTLKMQLEKYLQRIRTFSNMK